MGGILGTIQFDQPSPGSNITITIDLKRKSDGTTPSGNYQLALHETRVNYDVTDRCSTEHIGNVIGSPIQGITSGNAIISHPSNFDLSGTNTIEGRTFVFTDGATSPICAVVEAAGDYITAVAHLPTSLGGTVTLRQRANCSTAETVIYTNIYHTSMTTGAWKWQINDGVVAMDINTPTAIADRCGSTIGIMYDPASGGGPTCNHDNQQNCRIGDLSSKHGDVTVSTTGSMGFYADINLPLSGNNSIIGMTIVFMDESNNYACANIMQYPFMKAKATFNNQGVTGTIRVQQKSPLDAATITVDLRNLNNIAGGYHVHKYPVPQRLQQSDTTCGSADVAGHFNPFAVDTATDPASGLGTPDQFEVGDLSGKHGSLSGQDNYTRQFDDPSIQLFGKNSIMGRSIVMHKDELNSPRWICSTILPNVPMMTAVVRFVSPVIGYMILRQPTSRWAAETLVYAELDYSNDAAPSVDHNWHIHQTLVSVDMLTSTDRCQSAGGHYNPYNFSLAGDYATSGSVKHNHLRYELGDLAGKHGKLKIRTSSPGPQKFFFSDMQLPLSGPQSILHRSVVIHEANSGVGRLACANIYQRQTRTAAVTRWTSADSSANVTGSVTFRQDATATLSGVTSVSVRLSGLNHQAGGYHVHSYPTSFPSNGACSNVDVGGHLRPFNASYPGPAFGTQDLYELGDLSGKFEPLTGNSVTYDVNDMNLQMRGLLSIVGRSIVVHKHVVGAPRWVCGNVEETTIGSHVIQTLVTFTGDIYGTIHLQQSRYSDGEISDTAITVDLANSDGTTTTGHNWHIHVSPITGNCSTAGPHYNPYMVDAVHGYSECRRSNPLRCEMGDESRKVGPYDIGSGKRFFTDVNLPLEGAVSAAKRSVVVHAANSGGNRIACADLVPYGKPADEVYDLHFERKPYTKSDVEAKVAASIGVDTTNVQVVDMPNDALRCHVVRIYFLGPHAKQLRRLFNDVASSNNHRALKLYAPVKQCNPVRADADRSSTRSGSGGSSGNGGSGRISGGSIGGGSGGSGRSSGGSSGGGSGCSGRSSGGISGSGGSGVISGSGGSGRSSTSGSSGGRSSGRSGGSSDGMSSSISSSGSSGSGRSSSGRSGGSRSSSSSSSSSSSGGSIGGSSDGKSSSSRSNSGSSGGSSDGKSSRRRISGRRGGSSSRSGGSSGGSSSKSSSSSSRSSGGSSGSGGSGRSSGHNGRNGDIGHSSNIGHSSHSDHSGHSGHYDHSSHSSHSDRSSHSDHSGHSGHSGHGGKSDHSGGRSGGNGGDVDAVVITNIVNIDKH